jgi:hypothetical protein
MIVESGRAWGLKQTFLFALTVYQKCLQKVVKNFANTFGKGFVLKKNQDSLQILYIKN